MSDVRSHSNPHPPRPQRIRTNAVDVGKPADYLLTEDTMEALENLAVVLKPIYKRMKRGGAKSDGTMKKRKRNEFKNKSRSSNRGHSKRKVS